MRVLIRKYVPDDLDALQDLMSQLGYAVALPELRHNIDEISNRGGEIIVAEKDGAVVGSVCVLIDARLAEGICAEIVSLIVSEKERGTGIGKALVREAEAWASDRVKRIRVRANVKRSAAHLFYESKGFHEIKTQKVFMKKL